jgi:hypothetical protein
MNWPDRTSATTGNEFYHRAFAMTWKERDSFAEVNHKWMDYIDVLGNPVLQKLLCDEEYCDFYRYSY